MKACIVCGCQNEDSAFDCYKCRHPFPTMPPQPEEKSKAPAVIAALFAAVFLVVSGLFTFNILNSKTKFEIPEFDKLYNNMTEQEVRAVMGAPDREHYTSSADSVFGFSYDTFSYDCQLGEYTASTYLSFSTKPGTLGFASLNISYEYYFDDNQIGEDDIRILDNYKAELIEYFNGKLGTCTTERRNDLSGDMIVCKWTNPDGSVTELRVSDTYDYDYLELWWDCSYESRLYY